MSVGSVSGATAQASGSLKVVALANDQAKADGKSAVKLIETAGDSQKASPAHDGKGHKVNVLA